MENKIVICGWCNIQITIVIPFLGSLIKQHISFEHLNVPSPSALSCGTDKRKRNCDPWLQAAHHTFGEAMSTNLKHQYTDIQLWS